MDKNNEIKDYIGTINNITADEKKGLREWIACGGSIYDNPFGLCDEHGRQFDYVNAIRLAEDMEQETLTSKKDVSLKEEGYSFNIDLLEYIDTLDVTNCIGRLTTFPSLTGISIDLGISDAKLQNRLYTLFSINTQSSRKLTVKAIRICLSAIREAEKSFLDYIADYCMPDIGCIKSGNHAIDILGKIICFLADVY